jgi:hypothetical protein
MNLPDDIKIYIYRFLYWKDIKKIEQDKNVLKILIRLENPNKQCYERIYNNILNEKCFRCFFPLSSSYMIQICSYCKFTIDGNDFFPMYCGCCLPIKKNRNYQTRYCSVCNFYCVFVGIEPYS